MIFIPKAQEKIIYVFWQFMPLYIFISYLANEYSNWFFLLLFPASYLFLRIKEDQIFRIEINKEDQFVEMSYQGFFLFGLGILAEKKERIIRLDMENQFFLSVTGEYMQTRYKLNAIDKKIHDNFIISYCSMKSLEYAYNAIQEAYIELFLQDLISKIESQNNLISFGDVKIDKNGLFFKEEYYSWINIKNIELSGTRAPQIKLVTAERESAWIGSDKIPNYKLLISIIIFFNKKFKFILDPIVQLN